MAAATELDRAYGDAEQHVQKTFLMHSRLHPRIAECASYPAPLQPIENTHVLVFNWLFNSAAILHQLPTRWHRDLARVLTSGGSQAAESKMREHVRFAFNDVVQRLEAGSHLENVLSSTDEPSPFASKSLTRVATKRRVENAAFSQTQCRALDRTVCRIHAGRTCGAGDRHRAARSWKASNATGRS